MAWVFAAVIVAPATVGHAAEPEHGAAPREIGGEIILFAMDQADHDFPSFGRTLDASGSGNHGIYRAVDVVEGRYGDAYRFTPYGDFIEIADGATDNMPRGTVTFWMKIASQQGRGHILVKSDPGRISELFIGLDEFGRLRFATSQAAGSTSLTSPDALPENQWMHVALSWGSQGKRMFLDGILLATAENDTVGVGAASRATWIGNDPNTPSRTGLDGWLDDFRVFDRVLTPAEVRSVRDAPYVETLRRQVAEGTILVGTGVGASAAAGRGTLPDVDGAFVDLARRAFAPAPTAVAFENLPQVASVTIAFYDRHGAAIPGAGCSGAGGGFACTAPTGAATAYLTATAAVELNFRFSYLYAEPAEPSG